MGGIARNVANHQVDISNNNWAEQMRASLSVVADSSHNEEALRLLLIRGALCNDAALKQEG
jgi:hypothetical protein